MEGQGFKFYENSRYIDTRIQKKTLIIDIDIGTGTDISVTLEEPISINKESEIYLDSFTTYGALQNDATANTNMGFLLDIKEFNIQTISTNQKQNGKIVIPNEENESGSIHVKVHKGKKLNYICSSNPTTISRINGSITKLAGTGAMFAADGRFIAEFSIISRE
jgi:hypothetical protein